jgi:hypothetical protein
MNYARLLRQRHNHSLPRATHEGAADFIQCRNAEALIVWRARWTRRVRLPDAEIRGVRWWITAYYRVMRREAREWMLSRSQS